jgi:heme A synthase
VPAGARRLAPLGGLAVAVVYGQVVLGAFTTHGTALWWHVAGAVVTTAVLIGVALTVLRRAREDPILAWWARALKVILLAQLALGLGAYAVRFTDLAVPGGQLAVVALPVLHRAGGALVLGSVVALALQLGRRRALGAGIRAERSAVAVATEAAA